MQLTKKPDVSTQKPYLTQNFGFSYFRGLFNSKKHVPLIMDNTAAPYISKPIQHGANVMVYSTTKYIGGHGISIGGL